MLITRILSAALIAVPFSLNALASDQIIHVLTCDTGCAKLVPAQGVSLVLRGTTAGVGSDSLGNLDIGRTLSSYREDSMAIITKMLDRNAMESLGDLRGLAKTGNGFIVMTPTLANAASGNLHLGVGTFKIDGEGDEYRTSDVRLKKSLAKIQKALRAGTIRVDASGGIACDDSTDKSAAIIDAFCKRSKVAAKTMKSLVELEKATNALEKAAF